MKAFRILLTIVIAVVAVVAILVVVALVPAVQTWAVRKAVANQPGMKLDVSRVAAGFSSADVTDLRLVRNGLVVTAGHVHAQYSLWDYLAHHRLAIDDLTADGLVVDARAPTPAPAPTAVAGTSAPPSPTPRSAPSDHGTRAESTNAKHSFNGLLNEVQLPCDLRISRFSIPGRALLPNDQTVTFEVHGSDITTGQRGTVDWKADLASSTANAGVHAVHTSGTVNIHITTERRIDLLEVSTVASAEGANLPTDQLKLEVKAEQPAAGGNEGYSTTINLVRNGASESLATLAGQYNATSHEVAGVWNVNVRPEQLSALFNGFGLPAVAADGAGKFAVNPDAGSATGNGELRSTLSHLEKIAPTLAPIGSVNVHIAFNGGMANQVAQLDQFAINVSTADGRNLAEIHTLQRLGFSFADKRVTFADAHSSLARISIDSLPLAWAEPFAKPLTIDSGVASMVLAVAADADGSHVRLTSVQPLVLRDVTIRNGAQTLADRMTLSVKPQADYAADHLHVEFADLAVSAPTGDTVNGRLTADITDLGKTPSVAFSTDTQAKFVAMLKPYLNVETGPMTVATKSQGTLAGPMLHFESSSTRITREGGQLAAAIDLAQPITLNLQTNSVTTAKPDAESLRVTLGQIPLAWAQGFVPGAQFGGDVTGGSIGIVIRALDDLSAAATQPISLRGVRVTMNNQPMLRDVDVSADFTATKHGTNVAYNVRRIDAKQGPTTLLTFAATGEARLDAKPTVSAKGTLTADLGALAQQPMAAASDSLERGTLDASFDATIADTVQANATVTARNLVAKQNHQPLGEAQLTVTAAVQPDGSSVLKVPFTLTNGSRKSDLLIDGKLGRSGNTITFDGKITSNLLVIDDLKPLAALAPSSANPPAAAPAQRDAAAAAQPALAGSAVASPAMGGPAPTSATHDTQAFWSAAGGRVELDLKQIIYGKDYAITGVHGTTTITPAQIVLGPLQGNLKNNPFKLAATIDFDGKQAQPYTLNGTANVTNFDVGAFLQAANPNEKPQLETNVTIEAKLQGKGATAGNLTRNIYGTFDLNGSQGVLRALGQRAGSAVNGLSGLAGLAGMAQKSDTAVAIADLARKLAELPFDKFTMHVERGVDLNLKVGSIEFISPDTHLTGSGGIQNQPGVPIEKQPMQITLQLAGKGDMAVLLRRVKLLGAQQDAAGYTLMSRTFTLGGTPSKPNSDDLWKILAQVGLQEAQKLLPDQLQQAVPGLMKLLGH